MTTRDEELLEAKRIFDRAVELPPIVRAQFVERACSSSATLLEKVKQMLAHFYSESTPLVPPVNNANNQITDFDEDVEFDGTERFLVQRKLGSGGFGTVYEVIDRTCHATVALKVLNKVKPEFLYRFKQEFRALSQVRHENLVHDAIRGRK